MIEADERKRRDAERNKAWRLANPDKVREKRQKWRAANPDKRLAESRRYAAAHPEKIKEKWQRHQALHPEKAAANSQKYRDANREKVNASLRAYFQTPEGKAARISGEQRRRARKMNCEVAATAQDINAILLAAKVCAYCEADFTEELPPTLDHVIPLAKGGAHIASNLVAACRPCNSKKGTKMPEEFTTTGANVSVVATGDFT